MSGDWLSINLLTEKPHNVACNVHVVNFLPKFSPNWMMLLTDLSTDTELDIKSLSKEIYAKCMSNAQLNLLSIIYNFSALLTSQFNSLKVKLCYKNLVPTDIYHIHVVNSVWKCKNVCKRYE